MARSAAAPSASVAPAVPGISPGDEARLKSMLGDYFRLVWRTLRGLGVPSDGVDDAVQQVFMVASSRLPDIHPGKEKAFLVQSAVRVAANARRAHATRREHLSDQSSEEQPDGAPGPEQLVSEKQERELLERVLDVLEHDLRTVFVLFELEGFTSKEIAGMLDIPPGTAASRLRRARERFVAEAELLRANLAGNGEVA